MDGTDVASIIAAVIAAAAAAFTARSANRATTRSTEVTARTDIEKEAFERAKEFYTDTIDRLTAENREHEAKIDRLEQRVEAQDAEIHQLRDDLDVARKTLRLRYPDEE